jgi:hypothetical protein
MGWFSQRKTTVLEAFTLRRVLALPIVISVVTAVVHASVALSNLLAKGQLLLGVPSWVYGIVAGLLLVLFFFLEHATRLRIELEPRLNVSFNPDAEGITRTPTEVYAYTGSKVEKVRDDEAIYVRITLKSLSKATVKDCVAFVTKLEKKTLTDTEFIDIPLHGAIPLVPSPIVVYPRIPATIDFLKSGRYDNKLELSVSWSLRLRGALDDLGTYRFTIEVNGDGVTDTIRVEMNWNGSWESITGRRA